MNKLTRTEGRHILVPLDGSKRAERAIPQAIEHSGTGKARLFLLHVVEPPPVETVVAAGPLTASSPVSLAMIDQAQEQTRAEARDYLNALKLRLEKKADVECIAVIDKGSAVERIADSAERLDVDLIVLTSRRRTALATAVRGSVSLDVLHRVRCPVLLTRNT